MKFLIPEKTSVIQLDSMPTVAAAVLIIKSCNLNCIFCRPIEGINPEASNIADVKKKIKELRKICNKLLIAGGEPTCMEELKDIIKSAKIYGYEFIQIQSHGGRFADEKFTEELVKAGLDAVDIPIYGHTAELHDSITCTKGSFSNTIAGIKNLQKKGIKIVLHTVMLKQNLLSLPHICSFVKSLKPEKFSIQPVSFIESLNFYKEISPTLNQCREQLEKIDGNNITIDFPLCITTQATKELNLPIALPYSEVIHQLSGTKSKIKPEKCLACTMNEKCNGVLKEYLEVYGDNEIVPFQNIKIEEIKYQLENIQNIIPPISFFEKYAKTYSDNLVVKKILKGNEPIAILFDLGGNDSLHCLPNRMYGLLPLKNNLDMDNLRKIKKLVFAKEINISPYNSNTFEDIESSYSTFILRLDKPIEEIWNSSLTRHGRRGVKKAQENEIIVEFRTDIHDFYNLYIQKCARLNSKKLEKNHFKRIKKAFEKGFSIAYAKKDNLTIAAILFVIVDKYCMLIDNSSDNTYWSFFPNNVLIWKIIRLCNEKNVQLIDYGFTPNEDTDGAKFKENMGGERKRVYTLK